MLREFHVIEGERIDEAAIDALGQLVDLCVRDDAPAGSDNAEKTAENVHAEVDTICKPAPFFFLHALTK